MKRTPLKVINELEKTGDLKILVVSGFCSTSVVNNLEIQRVVDAKMSTGKNKSRAVREAAVEFNVSDRTVFRVMKSFEG